MLIQPFPSGPFETNAYVVACPKTHEAAIIDPAPDSAEKIEKYISAHGLIPKMILLTHSHWDHIADVSILKQRLHIPVGIHSLDLPNLQEPGSDGLPFWIPISGVETDQLLAEGDVIQLGSLKFRVIHTPGHTPGGICLYCQEEGVLISGDTLFRGSMGKVSFPTSNAERMWESLKKLAKLPPETKVYPGHGPSTTIGKESWLVNAKQIFDL